MLNLDGSKLAHAALNTEPETLYNPYSDDEGPTVSIYTTCKDSTSLYEALESPFPFL